MARGGSGGSPTTAVSISSRLIGAWDLSYGGIPVFGAFLTFATALTAGANTIPISFSTTVGSGVITLVQASIVALFINVLGATFACKGTVLDTLYTDDSVVETLSSLYSIHVSYVFFYRVPPRNTAQRGIPDVWSLAAVLMTTAIWLALATFMELPVSTQLSMQSALLGTKLATEVVRAMPVHKGLNRYFGIFMAAPVVACLIGFCFFGFLKLLLLRQDNWQNTIPYFLPICYGVTVGLLCLSLMYQVIPFVATIESWVTILAVLSSTLISALLLMTVIVPLAQKRLEGTEKSSLEMRYPLHHSAEKFNDQDLVNSTVDEEVAIEKTLKEFNERRVLRTIYEEDERSYVSQEMESDSLGLKEKSPSLAISSHSAPLKQLLESTPNRLTREYDRDTLIRHALSEKYDEKMEELFSFPHVLASLTLALAQSVNNVAFVIRPYGVIHDIFHHRNWYSEKDEIGGFVEVAWRVRAMEGLAASLGFFLCGRRLTHCLGGKLTYMSNSRGLSSQLGTIATVLLAVILEVPVSSSFAFIGSMVGVGIVDDARNVNWKLFIKFLCGCIWLGSIFFCCAVAYGIYLFTIHSPSYVVP